MEQNVSDPVRHIAVVRGVGETTEIPESVISPGFRVDKVATRASVMPVDEVANLLSTVAWTEAAMRAASLGYDGVLIADYGLSQARDAVPIPVVATGQAGLLLAAGLGQRIGIATIWPASTGPVYHANVAANGLTSRFVGVRHVTADAELATLADDDNFYVQMRNRQEAIIERILEAVQLSVDVDGAQVVMLGCNCMTPVSAMVAERAPVPIVDPLLAGYKMLETLLQLGLTPYRSPSAAHAPSRSAMFLDLVDTAAAHLAGHGSTADCDVCEITAAFADAADHPTITDHEELPVS